MNPNLLPVPAPRTAPDALPVPVAVPVFGFVCPVCLLDSIPLRQVAEAEYLAGLHDDTHHGGNVTSFITASTIRRDRP